MIFKEKTNYTRYIALTAFASLFLSSALAEETPSLQETLSWMDSTFNAHSNGGSFGRGEEIIYDGSEIFKRKTQIFTYDGCKITLVEKEDPSSSIGKTMYMDTISKFNLRDVDPSSIRISKLDAHQAGHRCDIDPKHMICDLANIDFEIRNQEPLIDKQIHATFPKLEGKDHENVHQSKSYMAVWVFDDPEYADRFAKAFINAINLCGGKRSAF